MQNNINLSSRIKLLFVMILAVASINLLLVFNSQRKAILKPVSFNTIEILNNTFFVNESKLQSEKKIKNHLLPFIFIGGYARSGTTLMRALLDVHSNIKCGPETKILPPFIDYANNWRKNYKNLNEDLTNANIQTSLIDAAIVEFITHIMLNRGFTSPRYCAKDPNIVKNIEYLNSIFPNAKFIYMIRDGRAAVYSHLVQLKELHLNYKLRSYLTDWYYFNDHVYNQCNKVGPGHCLLVHYEDLVFHPEKTLRHIMKFLNEDWSPKLLEHEKYIGYDISVSKTEWSSHQIIKPINSQSVNEWQNKLNINLRDMKLIAPMLSKFNYSSTVNNQNNLNLIDDFVRKNDQLINQNAKYYENLANNVSDHVKKLKIHRIT